jgi:L-amino acid N-acyltransferase
MFDRVQPGAVTSRAVSIRTRRVTHADAEAVRSIYNLEVVESTVTMDLVPRTLEVQQEWIRNHSGVFGAVVAVDDNISDPTHPANDLVVGFSSISPWRTKPAYSTSVENSVYVHRDHQNRGLGRILLDEALRVAVDSGFHVCFARIMAGHEASIRLHASRGFEVVGIEREVARKFGRWIDITVMQRIL